MELDSYMYVVLILTLWNMMGKFVEHVGNKPLHHELPLDPDPSSWSILALALAFFEDFVQSLLCIFDELLTYKSYSPMAKSIQWFWSALWIRIIWLSAEI